MQSLARLRTKAARLRDQAIPACADVLTTLDETLELTDTMLLEAAATHKRNLELEAELNRSAGEIRALLDSLPQPVLQTDCAGQIVEANRAAAALLGVSQARLRNDLLLHFAQDRGAFTDLVRALPRDGQPVHASARFRPRDRAPFEAAITVLRDPRSGDQRWLWLLDRVGVSAAQTPARTPSEAAGAASPSEPCGT